MTVYFKAFSVFTFLEIWAQNIFSEWTHSCSHSHTHNRHNRFVSASWWFLRWSILEVSFFRWSVVRDAKAKCEQKWRRELQGFRSTRKEGLKSRIPLCSLFESRIPTPWKHEILLPLVIFIPASRSSFEPKSRISRRKSAESRIPPNLLGNPLLGNFA